MITVKIYGRDFKSWIKTLKKAGFRYDPANQTWTGDESRLPAFQIAALTEFAYDAAAPIEAPARRRNLDGPQTLAEWRTANG